MRRIILAAILAALPSFASAASVNHPNIVTYKLEGSALLSCHVGSPSIYGGECDPEWSTPDLPLMNVWDGTITVDERKLSQPLGGRTLRVEIPPMPSPGDYWEWEVPQGDHEAFTFDLGFLPVINSIGGSILELTTTDSYFPLSWSIFVISGPPDYFLSSTGPSWMTAGSNVYMGPSGRLSLHSIVPIPLPPAAALLLAGAGALVLVRRRRERAAGGAARAAGG